MKSSIVVASSHAAPEAFAVLRGFDEASAIAHDLPVPDPITAARESVDSLRELFRC